MKHKNMLVMTLVLTTMVAVVPIASASGDHALDGTMKHDDNDPSHMTEMRGATPTTGVMFLEQRERSTATTSVFMS